MKAHKLPLPHFFAAALDVFRVTQCTLPHRIRERGAT